MAVGPEELLGAGIEKAAGESLEELEAGFDKTMEGLSDALERSSQLVESLERFEELGVLPNDLQVRLEDSRDTLTLLQGTYDELTQSQEQSASEEDKEGDTEK